jgi:Homeodomain-like domain
MTSNVEVAGRLGVTRPTVGKWRSRFVTDRLDGGMTVHRISLRHWPGPAGFWHGSQVVAQVHGQRGHRD